jgi:Domain of unknown function (DUF4157)
MYAPKQYRPEKRKPESKYLALEGHDDNGPVKSPPAASKLGGEQGGKEQGPKQGGPVGDQDTRGKSKSKKHSHFVESSIWETKLDSKTKTPSKEPVGRSESPPQFKLSAGTPQEHKSENDPAQLKKASEGGASVASSGKNGLPDQVKAQMEGAFGTSFDDVKITANSSKAKEAGALAFAQGNNIHFAPGQYNPESKGGQELLGHELAHVVQQRQGRVQANAEVNGLPVNNDHALESEADQMGAKAAAYKGGAKGGVEKGASLGGGGAVQMKVDVGLEPVVQQKKNPHEGGATEQESDPWADRLALDGMVDEKKHVKAEKKTEEGRDVPDKEAGQESQHQNGEGDEAKNAEDGPEHEDQREAAADGEKSNAKEDQAPTENESKEVQAAEDGLAADVETQPKGDHEGGVQADRDERAHQSPGGDEVAQLAPDPGASKGIDWAGPTLLPPEVENAMVDRISKGATSLFEKIGAPDWLKSAAKTGPQTILGIVRTARELKGEFIEGAVLGDFKKDPTIMNVVGQVLVGLIPVVGQITDIRDLVASIKDLATDGGYKDGGKWLNLGLNLLACVPVLGDAAKAYSKFSKLSKVQNALGALEPASKWIKSGWASVSGFLGPKISRITSKLSESWKSLKTGVLKRWDNLKATVSSKLQGAKSWIKSKWESFKSSVSNFWAKGKELLANGAQKVKRSIDNAAQKIAKVAAEAPQKVITRVKAMWDGVKAGIQKGKQIANGIIDGIKARFTRMKNWVVKQYQDWKKKGKGEDPSKSKEELEKKAIELPAALRMAKSITALNEKAGTPATGVIAQLLFFVKKRYRWIKNFVAVPIAPGHDRIELIASRYTIDDDYDPKGKKSEESTPSSKSLKNFPSSVDPDIPLQSQLAGKGQLKALRSNPNLKGVDIERLLRMTPRQIESELAGTPNWKKTIKQISKAFEGRDLGNRGKNL